MVWIGMTVVYRRVEAGEIYDVGMIIARCAHLRLEAIEGATITVALGAGAQIFTTVAVVVVIRDHPSMAEVVDIGVAALSNKTWTTKQTCPSPVEPFGMFQTFN